MLRYMSTELFLSRTPRSDKKERVELRLIVGKLEEKLIYQCFRRYFTRALSKEFVSPCPTPSVP
jgi:hypothetical protein